MIDETFYLRQIDVWNSSQPRDTKLAPAEMEQLAEHLHGNTAQLLALEGQAKDSAFDALLEAAKWLQSGFATVCGGEHMPVEDAISIANSTDAAIAAAEELTG